MWESPPEPRNPRGPEVSASGVGNRDPKLAAAGVFGGVGVDKIMNERLRLPLRPCPAAGAGSPANEWGRGSAEGRDPGGVTPGKGMRQGEGVSGCKSY